MYVAIIIIAIIIIIIIIFITLMWFISCRYSVDAKISTR